MSFRTARCASSVSGRPRTNANWLAERRNANWEAVSDGSPMEDREVRLSDLEMDYSK